MKNELRSKTSERETTELEGLESPETTLANLKVLYTTVDASVTHFANLNATSEQELEKYSAEVGRLLKQKEEILAIAGSRKIDTPMEAIIALELWEMEVCRNSEDSGGLHKMVSNLKEFLLGKQLELQRDIRVYHSYAMN